MPGIIDAFAGDNRAGRIVRREGQIGDVAAHVGDRHRGVFVGFRTTGGVRGRGGDEECRHLRPIGVDQALNGTLDSHDIDLAALVLSK